MTKRDPGYARLLARRLLKLGFAAVVEEPNNETRVWLDYVDKHKLRNQTNIKNWSLPMGRTLT
jgi:hypothetical protein